MWLSGCDYLTKKQGHAPCGAEEILKKENETGKKDKKSWWLVGTKILLHDLQPWTSQFKELQAGRQL